jgi:TonB family protein
MIAITQEHPLWSTREVWLGRAAAVPLALALNACLLTAAAIQQFLVPPLPEPRINVRLRDLGVPLPPICDLGTRLPEWKLRPAEPRWPDFRAHIRRPIQPPPPPKPPSPPFPENLEILRIHAGIAPPVLLHRESPRHPDVARRARIQGIVIIEVIIDCTGKVLDARVLRGLPAGCNEAAIEAVRKWRYWPATLSGKPVAVYLTEIVEFRLT